MLIRKRPNYLSSLDITCDGESCDVSDCDELVEDSTSGTNESFDSASTVNLLDRLINPKSTDIARKRRLRTNPRPPVGKRRSTMYETISL